MTRIMAGMDEKPEDPTPDPPPARPDPLAAARLAQDRKRAAADARLVAAARALGPCPNPVTLLARELRLHKDTVRSQAKRLGIDLNALRRGWDDQRQQRKDLKPGVAPAGKRASHLDWTVLQLFDTLMGYFWEAEPDSDADDGPDPRRTWAAWRVFLAASFGRLLPELATNNSVVGYENAGLGSGQGKKNAKRETKEVTQAGRSQVAKEEPAQNEGHSPSNPGSAVGSVLPELRIDVRGDDGREALPARGESQGSPDDRPHEERRGGAPASEGQELRGSRPDPRPEEGGLAEGPRAGAAVRDVPGDRQEEVSDDPLAMPEYPGSRGATCPRGAADLQPGDDALTIFQKCTGRTEWPSWQSRIVSLVVGRRGGKSYITAVIGIYLALCKKYRLSLGTKGMVMILARDREQAGVIRGYVLAFLKTRPLAPFLAAEPTQKLIELTNGITIEIRSVSEAGTRGYTVVAALLDEVAFWPTDADSAKQDKKVLRAIRPAMLGIADAMIVMLSSPYAKRGELWENYRNYFGKDDERRHLVWNADTLSMRPSDDPDLLAEIAAEYEEDPENAKAEYGAQFRSDLEAIYTKTAVEAVCVPGRREVGCVEGRQYRAFVDPSGGSADSYVLAICHDEVRPVKDGPPRLIPVLDLVREWVPKFDTEEVSAEVAAACRAYGVSAVTGDAYGGEWPREPLRRRGIDYVLSDYTRSELYLGFLPLVNSQGVELLDPEHHKRMVNQFANLERRTGRTGRDAVDHGAGGHDDVANAVAGAVLCPAAGGTFQGLTW